MSHSVLFVRKICIFVIILTYLVKNSIVDAIIWRGSLRTIGSWKFIDRFVHVPTPEDKLLSSSYGLLNYQITHPINMKLTLMIYHQDFTDWKRIYNSKASDRFCDDMILEATHFRHQWADTTDFKYLGIEYFDLDGLVGYSDYDSATTFGKSSDDSFAVAYADFLADLSAVEANRSEWFSNSVLYTDQGNASAILQSNFTWPTAFVNTNELGIPTTVTYNGTYAYASNVPVWSFVAVANCDVLCLENGSRYCQGPLDNVDYVFELTNGESLSRKHFSYDEIGIMDTQIVLFCFLTLMICYGLWVRRKLLNKQKFHHTVRILIYSIVLNWLSLTMGLGYYGTLAWKGSAEKGAAQAERIFFAMSDTLLVLLLILLAKGWTIVRPKISIMGRVKIAIFMTLYFMVSVIGAVWRDGFLDRATSIYVYQTDPGIMLIILRLLAAAWFQYAAYTTQKNFVEKRSFYRVFNSVFSIWLLYVPFTALVVLGLPETEMEKSAYIMERLFYFTGQLVLIVLYNPDGMMRRSFPFHANQSAMNQDMPKRGIAQNNTMQVINAKGQASGITGGTQVNNVSDKIVLMDSFEQMHMKRLKNISDHIEYKLARLSAVSKTMQQALAKVHVPDENSIDDGWGPRTTFSPARNNRGGNRTQDTGFSTGNGTPNPSFKQFHQGPMVGRPFQGGRQNEAEMTNIARARSFHGKGDSSDGGRRREPPRPGFSGTGRGGGPPRGRGRGRGQPRGRSSSGRSMESPREKPKPRQQRQTPYPDDEFEDPPSNRMNEPPTNRSNRNSDSDNEHFASNPLADGL